jgi:membrane associated rhomboid family serine protease
MHRPPSLSELPAYPITALLCVGAALVSIASMGKPELVATLAMDGDPIREPWRFVSCILPHGSPMHLIFNLYWVWSLGSALERIIGPGRYLGFVVLTAVVSSGADWLLASGGIGLSGVVYGVFGLLWTMRNKPRYVGLVDRVTYKLFMIWLVLCVVLTYTGIMAIGNFAHGFGLLVGVMVGRSMKARGTVWGVRGLWAGGVAALALTILGMGATVRERVNLVNFGVADTWTVGEFAVRAILEGRTQDAIRHLERLVERRPEDVMWWTQLASQYHAAGRENDAGRAVRRALEIDPTYEAARALMEEMEAREPAPEPAPGSVEPEPASQQPAPPAPGPG